MSRIIAAPFPLGLAVMASSSWLLRAGTLLAITTIGCARASPTLAPANPLANTPAAQNVRVFRSVSEIEGSFVPIKILECTSSGDIHEKTYDGALRKLKKRAITVRASGLVILKTSPAGRGSGCFGPQLMYPGVRVSALAIRTSP